MSEQKTAHTPGPWTVEDPMDHELWIVQGGKQSYDWEPIATCPWPDEDTHLITSRQVKANAALIAEAPDLLAVLKHFVHWHDQLQPHDIARAQAVIAKAEGRSNV